MKITLHAAFHYNTMLKQHIYARNVSSSSSSSQLAPSFLPRHPLQLPFLTLVALSSLFSLPMSRFLPHHNFFSIFPFTRYSQLLSLAKLRPSKTPHASLLSSLPPFLPPLSLNPSLFLTSLSPSFFSPSQTPPQSRCHIPAWH